MGACLRTFAPDDKIVMSRAWSKAVGVSNSFHLTTNQCDRSQPFFRLYTLTETSRELRALDKHDSHAGRFALSGGL